MQLLLSSFTSVLSTIGYVILAILVLMFMITIHEFGHYIAGKKLGFKINEFSIGFGKSIFSKTLKSGEKFSIRLIPLGGYCAFDGEDASSTDPNAFNNKHPFKRLVVLFMGAFFNFLSAIIFSFILLVGFGFDIPEVKEVTSTVNTNIQVGDVITKVDNEKITFIDNKYLPNLIQKKEVGSTITLTIIRNGKVIEEDVVVHESTPDKNGNTSKVIGVNTMAHKYGFFEALGRSFVLTFELAYYVLKILFLLITFRLPIKSLGGPITTITTIATQSQANIASLFVMLPLIAANLAVFNWLPFPALDGSRMVFTTIEWIRKKPINPKIEGTIHTVGLWILMTFVIVVDIIQLFT